MGDEKHNKERQGENKNHWPRSIVLIAVVTLLVVMSAVVISGLVSAPFEDTFVGGTRGGSSF
jgi:hypothetical protein